MKHITYLKQRKVINEYYVGTEESRNNTSTFIDKQEYYKSILERMTAGSLKEHTANIRMITECGISNCLKTKSTEP